MMRDDVRDRGIQTLVYVFPHVIEPEDAPCKVYVRSRCGVQTEAHLEFGATSEEVEDTLQYTPYTQIIEDSVAVQDIPKKFVLKFDDNITEEDIESFDYNSSWDPTDILNSTDPAKSNLRRRIAHMEDPHDEECQTTLTVRPMILDTDEVADVLCDVSVQTSMTFFPGAKMEEVNSKLHSYMQHKPGSNVFQPKYRGVNNEDSEMEKMREAVRQLTSMEIEELCVGCCSEEEVLERIKEWYKDVANLIDESEPEDEFIDEITGEDIGCIEANIVAGARMTVEHLEAQVDRMNQRYNKPETVDVNIQCQELADHLEPGLCRGNKQHDKACTCDCQLYTKKEAPPPSDADCAKQLAQLYEMMKHGVFSGRLGETSSSPALIKCPCPKHQTTLPLPARACTNRKCNCLYSKGCLPCEQALRKQKTDMDPNKILKIKSSKKNCNAQNIEFLADVEGDYTDEYLENLGQDDVYTQTEAEGTKYFGTPEALVIPEPPCSCLTNVEIPWDLLLIPPKPKPRPSGVAAMESLPEVVRAQLKELTVRPITEEQLLDLTREFLQDNIGNVDDIEEIQKQILAEKARITAEAAKEEGKEEEEMKDGEDDEEPYVPCRPRPILKQFQVYDPECEEYYEPYMDRIVRAFEAEELGELGECTSRVEMPWHEIALAKKIVIRRGRHPCERPVKNMSERDPNRKCGPEYREKMALQGSMFDMVNESTCDLPTCGAGMARMSTKGGNQGGNDKGGDGQRDDDVCSICELCLEGEQDKSLKKADTESCICGPECLQESQEKNSHAQIISCMSKGKRMNGKQQSNSMPTINSPTSDGAPAKSSQARTERIAALLDSCKKEMEPIKNGINELRARIKELNIPDMMGYQEPPQHPSMGSVGAGSGALGGFMGGAMGMQMPPVCFPPMMCYPYPPPGMFPSPFPPMVSPNAQVTNIPPGIGGTKDQDSSKKCVCKSCRTKYRRKTEPAYNSSTETGTASTDYDRHHHNKNRSPKRSRSRFICSCKPQESKNTEYPSQTNTPQTGTETNDTTDTADKTGDNAGPEKSPSSCKGKSTLSKIPRLLSGDLAKKSSCVCPSPIEQAESTFKSCKSNLSEKSVKSEKSGNSIKSCLKDSTKEKGPKRESLMYVESAGTQKSDSREKASASTSCKIRFEGVELRTCSRCKSAQRGPMQVEAGAEVYRGRPTEESSEDASSKVIFESCKSRKAN